MMNRSRKNALIASILSGVVFIAFTLLTRASGTPDVSPLPPVTLKPLATWTADLVLKYGELPSGWSFGGQTSYDEQGMPSHFYGFKNFPAEQAGATLSEEFIVYSTTVLAEQAYPHVRDQYFPLAYAADWKTMPELVIQHHADEIKIACMSGTINGSPDMVCRAIARYHNVIVQTIGNLIPDRWLTLSDFRQMLEAVDRRVAEVMSK